MQAGTECRLDNPGLRDQATIYARDAQGMSRLRDYLETGTPVSENSLALFQGFLSLVRLRTRQEFQVGFVLHRAGPASRGTI